MISAGMAGLIGAAIGGSISISTSWFAQKAQSKRELIKLAYEMAAKDYDIRYENIKNTGGSLLPLESFVTYHLKYIEIVVEKGKLEPADLKKLKDYRDRINTYYSGEFLK